MDNSYNFFGSGVGGTVTPRAGPGRVRWLGSVNNNASANNNAPANNNAAPNVLPTTLQSSDPLKMGIVGLIILYGAFNAGIFTEKKHHARKTAKAFQHVMGPKDVSNITG